MLPLAEACRVADVVLTVPGVRHTLRAEHFPLLKSNVLLANAGHFWEEIDVAALAKLAAERKELRANVEGFRLADGRWLNLLGGGNIVNIASNAGLMGQPYSAAYCASKGGVVQHTRALAARRSTSFRLASARGIAAGRSSTYRSPPRRPRA